MNIGAMRDRFTIERGPTGQDEYGASSPAWAAVREVWGAIRTLGGRQLQLAQANTLTSTATHEIRTRYHADIFIATTRLTLPPRPGTTATRAFDINAIDDVDNRHVELVLTVTEVKA